MYLCVGTLPPPLFYIYREMINDACFHSLPSKQEELPEKLNCPYYYQPNELVLRAVADMHHCLLNSYVWCDETHATLDDNALWQQDLAKGKMLGVLIVEDRNGSVGYLKAYSGQIAGRSDWEGWVPAVFDYLDPNGYFCTEEARISGINKDIERLKGSSELKERQQQLADFQYYVEQQITSYRQMMAESKRQRDELRSRTGMTTPEMIRESQYQKAELRRLRQSFETDMEPLRSAVDELIDEIKRLKEERRKSSDALQQWLFSQFVMLNGKGERATLLDIFRPTSQRIPPSGAGECCAPRLLQYAFQHGYRPLAIAEFWYGTSPVGECRREGDYYPACQGKCRPILDFMLQGVDVEPNSLEQSPQIDTLEILYEDERMIAVNKPSGLLSVPGKVAGQLSAIDILLRQRRDLSAIYSVHRLDMHTSGVLLFAKDEAMQSTLHRMFEQRQVHKTYHAVLEGVYDGPREGTISLPLSADYINRPRQRVDKENGKEAVTNYKVVRVEGGHTYVELTPLTGRTHQLRVHCAHPEGLGMPILGDPIYGHQSGRMMLHAARLEMVNPLTCKILEIKTIEKMI